MTPSGAAERMATLRRASSFIADRSGLRPRAGFVLGTGARSLAEEIEADLSIPYAEIPGFPQLTVEFHEGRLILGTLSGVPVAALLGRAHRYEGHGLDAVTDPIRVLRLLGAETLVLTGACGGLDPLLGLGDLVLLDDHLNLTGESPLVGPNLDELGPRFPDMSEPYDHALQRAALDAALRLGIPLRRGVYAGVIGPELSTRAEYRMLRLLGADVVGMSTVPEVIVARHAGMRVLAVPFVTDRCLPDALEEIDVDRVLAVAAAAEPKVTSLVVELFRDWEPALA